MMRALRAVFTERGYDIRELTLVAFGGAGPIHAAALCESVGITRLIILPDPDCLALWACCWPTTGLIMSAASNAPSRRSARAR